MEREKIQKELRRNRSTLAIVGIGVIAFGAWSVVKTVLILALRVGDPLGEGALTENVPPELMRAVFYGATAFLLLIDLVLRLYVGLSARREGLAGKKGSAYIVLACLLAVMSVYSCVYSAGTIIKTDEPAEEAPSAELFQFDPREGEDVDDAVVSTLVEITATVTLIELIVAGVRVKRLRKLAAEQEA